MSVDASGIGARCHRGVQSGATTSSQPRIFRKWNRPGSRAPGRTDEFDESQNTPTGFFRTRATAAFLFHCHQTAWICGPFGKLVHVPRRRASLASRRIRKKGGMAWNAVTSEREGVVTGSERVSPPPPRETRIFADHRKKNHTVASSTRSMRFLKAAARLSSFKDSSSEMKSRPTAS